MKKWAGVFIGLLLFPFVLFAQEPSDDDEAAQTGNPVAVAETEVVEPEIAETEDPVAVAETEVVEPEIAETEDPVAVAETEVVEPEIAETEDPVAVVEPEVDTVPTARAEMEIPNQVGAIKTAQPGDYIVLPSGNKYILTREELMIMKGAFGYENLSDVATKTRADGTVIRTVSQAHEIQIYPNGKVVHVIKTNAAYAYTLKYIAENYHLMRYLDNSGILRDSKPLNRPNFNVFRVFIQTETITNGFDKLEAVVITAYNNEGKNYTIKYCSVPNLVWGLVSSEELFKTVFRSINEKWEITSPGGVYSSFEFNRDRNYIAVEKSGPVHFGKYFMPTEDTIDMENLGILKINEDKVKLGLSFTPVGGSETKLTALRAEKMPESRELDLFTRSWKVQRSSYRLSDAGIIVLFSNAGTYLVYEIDGSVRLLSHWRWSNDKHEEWEFSHDKGRTWRSVRNVELRENYLKWVEAAGTIEFVPANK